MCCTFRHFIAMIFPSFADLFVVPLLSPFYPAGCVTLWSISLVAFAPFRHRERPSLRHINGTIFFLLRVCRLPLPRCS